MDRKFNYFKLLFSVLFFGLIFGGCAPKPTVMGIFPHEMRMIKPGSIDFDSDKVKIWHFQHPKEEVWEACIDLCLQFNGGLGQIQYLENGSRTLVVSRQLPISRYRKPGPRDRRIPKKTYNTWVTLAFKVIDEQENPAIQSRVKIVDLYEPGVELDYSIVSNNDPKKRKSKKKSVEEMRVEAVITVLSQFYYEIQQRLTGPAQWKGKFFSNT